MRPFAGVTGITTNTIREREAMIRIGAELRELREKRGLTLRGLCEIIGVSAPFLSDVEHGRRRMSHIDEIAKALGVDPMHFYELAGLCPHCEGSGFAGVVAKRKAARS